MSALRLEFMLILCFYGTTRTDADVEGVVWKKVGQSVTIQCRSTHNQETLNLKKGLNEEQDIVYTMINSSKFTIDSKFTERLQYHKKFTSVDILIKNLTLNDTGPYWCVYKMTMNYAQKITKGSGSVLLVVTENKPSTNAVHECQQSQNDMVLWAVVISAAVVIVILSIFLILMILKNKPSHNTVKRRQQVPTNDVYEDMRGTIRR